MREYTVIEFATGSVWVFGPSGGILRDDLKSIEEARQFIEEQAVVSRYPRVVNMTLSQNQATAEATDDIPDPSDYDKTLDMLLGAWAGWYGGIGDYAATQRSNIRAKIENLIIVQYDRHTRGDN